MIKQINSKVFLKCLQMAAIMTLFGIIVQVVKGQLILKLPRPQISFIIGVVISYIILGTLYAVAFYIFRNALPGKKSVQRGLFYAFFCSVTVLIPGVLGMIAFDFEGGYDLFTSYKIEQFFILLVDAVNLFIGGLVMTKFFKDDMVFPRSAERPQKGILISCLIGAVLFPLLMLVVHMMAEGIFPLGLEIPVNAKLWYYKALIFPFILTGGFLPWFYQSVKDVFPGKWARKSFNFFLVFYCGYWVINVGFMLNFGFSLHYVLFLLGISILSLLLITMLNGFVIDKISKEGQPDAKDKR